MKTSLIMLMNLGSTFVATLTSHCTKGSVFVGGKKEKDRITVLLCANMSGSEKRPLFVIGKSKQPLCS